MTHLDNALIGSRLTVTRAINSCLRPHLTRLRADTASEETGDVALSGALLKACCIGKDGNSVN